MIRQWMTILLFLFSALAYAQDEEYVSLEERLKSNIFLKVEASSTDCFVGEPIIVTYKLYSALNSESRITKSPSFSGFEVKDLKGGSDELASRETVDGISFDVHTLLRLQLTPAKAGKLVLGSLSVRNSVRLVNNGREDPILDGVREGYSLDNGYFNLSISSVPVPVLVTDIPGNRSTTRLDGPVGDFKMDVQVAKKVLEPGEQNALTITITGRGDFSKVKLPVVAWPEGVNRYPVKIDEDKTTADDGSGFKAFTVPFSVKQPGTVTIPSVRFSFFDAVNYQFKTITNIPIELSITGNADMITTSDDNEGAGNNGYYNNIIISLIILALLVVVLGVILRYRKKRRLPATVSQEPLKTIEIAPVDLDVEAILYDARLNLPRPGSDFYISLKQALSQFLELRLQMPAQNFDRELLLGRLKENDHPDRLQAEIVILLSDIDLGIYSGGATNTDRAFLLDRAKKIMTALL